LGIHATWSKRNREEKQKTRKDVCERKDMTETEECEEKVGELAAETPGRFHYPRPPHHDKY
jgi:hypothetical protein